MASSVCFKSWEKSAFGGLVASPGGFCNVVCVAVAGGFEVDAGGEVLRPRLAGRLLQQFNSVPVLGVFAFLRVSEFIIPIFALFASFFRHLSHDHFPSRSFDLLLQPE